MTKHWALPDLDAQISKRFTWRSLIECGETFERLTLNPADKCALPTLPAVLDSWACLASLACEILDPVYERFCTTGVGFQVTYGFAPAWLTAQIESTPGHLPLCPKLDQHAACEVNSHGKPICPRGGAAVDFRFAFIPSDEVAAFVIKTLPFDKLYFYGRGRSLHVSWHEEPKREAYSMLPTGKGGLRPCRLDVSQLPTEGGDGQR
jgi:hypothetical protein